MEKCPMCGLQKSCDLMSGKAKNGSTICCCTNMQKKSVKKP